MFLNKTVNIGYFHELIRTIDEKINKFDGKAEKVYAFKGILLYV